MNLNILLIPEKRGRRGHPKIHIRSIKERNGYIINGFCKEFGFQEINESEHEGIENVLAKVFKALKE